MINHFGKGKNRLLTLIVFCLTMLIVAGCAEIRVQPIVDTATPVTPTETPVPSATPAPTNTVIWFPATPTTRPMRTPTPYPVVNELPDTGGLILADNFSDESHWQTYRSGIGNAVMSNNEMTLAIQKSNSSIASFSSLPQYGDYFLRLDVSLSLCTWNEDWYGIAFRVADSENQYRWLFNCMGQTRVDRFYRGRTYTIVDWDINGVVKPSAPQKFTIGIAAQGSELRFYANDKLLASTEDTIFTTGGYGLLASSSGYGPLTVSFSNFTLSEIY